MSNSSLKSLFEIFNDRIFRIPDYQRGYSWEHHHIDDFWRDLENISKNRYHYTGMITVEKVDDYYNVIDGQQRLTTIIILIKSILDKFENDDWLSDNIQKKNAVDKYLYKSIRGSKNPNIIFAYKENNSSYNFYKTKILEINNRLSNYEKTLYINNLDYVNKFFKIKIKVLTKDELEILFYKITKQLRFNLYEIDKSDGVDEYIIFETMNNRGKSLTLLEILKNRLIYISTLLDNNGNDKRVLRKNINKYWKTIYEYIGKTTDKKIIDDKFLKDHSLMYWGITDKIKDDLQKRFLLDEFFIVQKISVKKEKRLEYQKVLNFISNIEDIYLKLKQTTYLEIDEKRLEHYIINIDNNSINIKELLPEYRDRFKYTKEAQIWEISKSEYIRLKEVKWIKANEDLYLYLIDDLHHAIVEAKINLNKKYITYETIDDYILSLKSSIISYYNILNPLKTDFDDEIKEWLSKLNRLGCEDFMPLMIPIFNSIDNIRTEDIVSILKLIENFIFVKKYLNNNSRQGLDKRFYTIAYDFNSYQNINNFIVKLDNMVINFQNSRCKIFNLKNFILIIEKLFQDRDKKGFYDWKGLKYLLYEYELYLKKSEGVNKILWDNITTESIEHIYPQKPNSQDWSSEFLSLKESQNFRYLHSIGNLLLISSSKNSSLGNRSFFNKKDKYSNGSYSEIEVSKNDDWRPKDIEQRGLNILNFMKERWLLDISRLDLDRLK